MTRDAVIDEIVSDGAMDFFNDDGIVAKYSVFKLAKIKDFAKIESY